MEFRERLYQLRKGRGISQEELAHTVGVSRQAVQKWEAGAATPDLNNLSALADYFAVSLDYLVRGIEPEKPAAPSYSGTVNQFGAFLMRAVKVGEDSSIQRMIRLVQSADAGKAKIVSLADRWATWIVIIALTSAALTWLISGEIIRAVTILVVFCPCALVLATPTAIMAAIGNAT